MISREVPRKTREGGSRGSGAKDAASGARTLGGKEKKDRATEGANGIRRRRNSGELLLQRSVLRRAQEMNESEDGADGCANANHPTEHKIKGGGKD